MTFPIMLTLPALVLGLTSKLFLLCLKWLAHASIAAPAVAATFPFTEPPNPFTISPPASRSEDLPVHFPSALLRLCDVMADRGAYAARGGRAFNTYNLMAIPDDAKIDGAHDLLLLAWAARLGYREELEAGR